jgi:hypothetical protein
MLVRGRGLPLTVCWFRAGFRKGPRSAANGDIMCPFMYRLCGWVALAGRAANRSP